MPRIMYIVLINGECFTRMYTTDPESTLQRLIISYNNYHNTNVIRDDLVLHEDP